MKIAIVGSGALGMYYGGLLCRSEKETGVRVYFLVRSDYETVTKAGITVKSVHGDYELAAGAGNDDAGVVRAYNDAQAMNTAAGGFDLVLIGLKTTANDRYETLIRPLFTPGRTLLLSLQNGFGNENKLAGLFGGDAVLGGVSFLCSNRIAPGVIDHTDYGHMQLAVFDRKFKTDLEPKAYVLEELLNESDIQAAYNPDYLDMRWRKQVWNVPFNALCTIHNMGTEELLADATRTETVQAVMAEVIELAGAIHNEQRAAGVDRPANFGLQPDFIADQMAKTATMGNYLPSMLLDYRAGFELEIEGIVGACLTANESLGSPLPLVEIPRLYQELNNLTNPPVT